MNVYNDFFLGIDPDAWEFFAIDLLSSIGYSILRFPSRGADGGRDGLVSFDDKIYLVSCKHYLVSGKSVGTNDETSITDRIIQHGASGFIGFYSTLLSTSLENRFAELTRNGYECITYDNSRISNYLPRISSQILQKYGIPKPFKYELNVPEYSYKPLPCISCKIDILSEKMIDRSMALICLNKKEQLEYLYGCKRCLSNISDRGWVCLYQAIHPEELNGWISYVQDDMNAHKLSPNFYKHKSEFESAIQQRMFPSNWGRWLSL